MFTSLLLTTTLAAGQQPAPAYPYPPLVRTAAQPPATLPPAPPPGGQPMPMPKGDADGPPGNPDTVEAIKTDKAEPPAPTKYLLEKSLAETRLGNLLDDRGIRIYGWTEMSFNGSTARSSNAPVFMIDRANEFLLNQNYLVVEKTLDASKKEFQWGWAVNWILPGSDARTTVVRGLWDDQLRRKNGGPVNYPIDPYQFYGQFYLPNLGSEGTTVKVGRFNTHCSYEVVQAVDTPFVSRSYLFQYNPFTHTGVWATTPLNDTWTASYGLATGSDTFIDPANRATFIGQLKWAPPEGKTSILFNTVITKPRYDAAEAFAFYNYYGLVLTHKFTDKLTYVLDAAFSHINGVPGIGSTNWYGAANYFMYAHTDKLTSTFRAEAFEDTDGFRTGSRGLYQEYTYGLTWKPINSLLVRPSVRYDYNVDSRPFEGKRDLFTATIDLIVRW